MCGDIEVEDSCENGKIDIDERSSIQDMLLFAFNLGSDAIPSAIPDMQSTLGYYTVTTGR